MKLTPEQHLERDGFVQNHNENGQRLQMKLLQGSHRSIPVIRNGYLRDNRADHGAVVIFP